MEKRINIFDNLKSLLIFLVVFGHIISPLRSSSNEATFIYMCIYLFHMPLFLYIFGYFSKSTVKEGKIVKNKWFNFLLLYFLMQGVLLIIGNKEFSLLNGETGMWYIQCILIWILLLPFIDRIKPKYMLIISFILGILIGFDKNADHTLSLSRVFVFMPFFLLGLYTTEDHIKKLRTKKNKIYAVMILLAIILILISIPLNYELIIKFTFGKHSYSLLGFNYIGCLFRMLWYAVSILISVCIITLTSNKKNIFTNIGTKTLQVFCLHLIVYFYYKKYELYTYFDNPIGLIILAIDSFVLVLILSQKIFSYPFNKIMNVKFNKILKKY